MPRTMTDETKAKIKAKNSNTVDQFWERVDKAAGANACWPFIGHRDRLITNGQIAAKAKVLHKCDNPGCVNPLHLTAGTQADNMQGCVQRGRFAIRRGESSSQSKLTTEAVIKIRAERLRGSSMASLAAQFNVSESLICNIINGRAWAHVPPYVDSHARMEPEAIAEYIIKNITDLTLESIARCIRYNVPSMTDDRARQSIAACGSATTEKEAAQ